MGQEVIRYRAVYHGSCLVCTVTPFTLVPLDQNLLKRRMCASPNLALALPRQLQLASKGCHKQGFLSQKRWYATRLQLKCNSIMATNNAETWVQLADACAGDDEC